jgi:hypothetical protein
MSRNPRHLPTNEPAESTSEPTKSTSEPGDSTNEPELRPTNPTHSNPLRERGFLRIRPVCGRLSTAGKPILPMEPTGLDRRP